MTGRIQVEAATSQADSSDGGATLRGYGMRAS
jgi:hypothetical protein